MGAQACWECLYMLAATIQFFCITGLYVFGPAFVFWIVFFTRYWFIAGVYLIWIWIFDIHTCERGGRISYWFRRLKFFRYARDHFPVTLTAVPEFKLDPKRNYIFGCFPHGVLPNGVAIALMSNACEIDSLVPNHTLHTLTFYFSFKIPIYREYCLALGVCSVTEKSINWLLSYPNGGKIAAIVVGGATEAIYTRPGVYKIVLKNRKGFVRLAIKNGSPLVPVFSFGEVDIFKPLITNERFQSWFKQKIGGPLLILSGRGVCFIPFKKPINIVIGKPIEVEKNINPSQQEIDYLHQMFMCQLNKLFEEHKYKYIKDAENTTLTIV